MRCKRSFILYVRNIVNTRRRLRRKIVILQLEDWAIFIIRGQYGMNTYFSYFSLLPLMPTYHIYLSCVTFSWLGHLDYCFSELLPHWNSLNMLTKYVSFNTVKCFLYLLGTQGSRLLFRVGNKQSNRRKSVETVLTQVHYDFWNL